MILMWVWIDTYENTIFRGLFTSINPSYFDVNYRGTIGFDTLPCWELVFPDWFSLYTSTTCWIQCPSLKSNVPGFLSVGERACWSSSRGWEMPESQGKLNRTIMKHAIYDNICIDVYRCNHCYLGCINTYYTIFFGGNEPPTSQLFIMAFTRVFFWLVTPQPIACFARGSRRHLVGGSQSRQFESSAWIGFLPLGAVADGCLKNMAVSRPGRHDRNRNIGDQAENGVQKKQQNPKKWDYPRFNCYMDLFPVVYPNIIIPPKKPGFGIWRWNFSVGLSFRIGVPKVPATGLCHHFRNIDMP